MGLLLCQWAKHIGATVLGTVSTDEKARIAAAHGCDHPINYKNENFVDRVADITDGAGVKAVYDAVGATKSYEVPPYPSTHNLGTCRMSAKAGDGVCNKWGQTHDIKNLFISDGSQFTTGAAENPTLTIVSLAIRQADYIAEQMGQGSI